MQVEFTKMNGAGNDFILMDGRAGKLKLARRQIARICDRHAGAGADGLIVLRPCPSGRADWAWDFYNSDGRGAEMCGNGARCFARFVQRLTGAKNNITFETRAGIITAGFRGKGVTVSLTPPRNLRLNQTLALRGGNTAIHSVDTGVPHAVMFVPDADQAMVQSSARKCGATAISRRAARMSILRSCSAATPSACALTSGAWRGRRWPVAPA